MKEALELLSNDKLNPCIKFDEFAFLGHTFLLGCYIRNQSLSDGFNDNINNPSETGAQFKGFDPCNCDLIKLGSARIFYPVPTLTETEFELLPDLHIHYASLCDIKAVAFNYDCTQSTFENDLTKLLDEYNKKCKVKCDECCCNDGIFNAIYSPFSPNNLISLTAGWLVLKDAKVLGRVGNVLVLSNTGTRRIYFVCLDSVGFIGY